MLRMQEDGREHGVDAGAERGQALGHGVGGEGAPAVGELARAVLTWAPR